MQEHHSRLSHRRRDSQTLRRRSVLHPRRRRIPLSRWRVGVGQIDPCQHSTWPREANSGNGSAGWENVTEQSFVKRSSRVKTAAVFQRPTALPQLTVLQNLHLALSMMGIPKRDRDDRTKEAMTFFGLEKLSRSYPDSLSAGQKRRVDLARALAAKPRFLVLDEPTGDLDSSVMNLVMPLLRGLNKDHGMTILMTTALPRHASTAKHQIHLRPPIFRTEQPIAR